MKISMPIDPNKRIEIIDILRGFALLGIIFMNMSFFSGYMFMPFDELKQISNFELDNKLYSFLGVIVTGKFYTIFSILFAVGFYIQFNKNRDRTADFLKTYRRRLFILLIIGILHTLFWYGDILLTYSIFGFILILFRNVKPKILLRWSLFFLLVPFLFDFALLLYIEALQPNIPANTDEIPMSRISYPDMSNVDLINTFRDGSVIEIFKLNIHNFIWKHLGYIPSGGYFTFLGIFLLGYYLASIEFFKKTPKSTKLIVIVLICGIIITIANKFLGGNAYGIPTLQNIRYKFLSKVGQLLISLSYIMAIIKIAQTAIGKKVFKYLIPVGRTALSNYLIQTILMVVIFYNFGFSLFGKIGLIPTFAISIIIVIIQIIASNIWLKHYRFGPFEWVWRSLTYKKRINIRR
ncbi:hypothetical protein PW52_12885 [Tamlana sedimentorum]|uniref:DUF418 domain-containing protein n=1 Tax=Neotamlana sedimentorum TaxID=1435349 RepID=A0A0D7W788_9FLAO|nr:DUF418 domain-containing protein [Tamlana sedimentorum]KJD34985.1 hypothetical protein PW52_12885 [Tamlana sedimentorum]